MTVKNIIFILSIVASSIVPTACLAQVFTLFSHGIADSWKQVQWYTKSYVKDKVIHPNNRPTIYTPFFSFNYPDATTAFYRVNWHETSFGQANEMERLNKSYKNIMTKFPGDCDIILYGISRGASNALIFAGRYEIDHVRALIAESPYNLMDEVIENAMKKKNMDWLPLSYGQTVAEFIFKKYKRDGNSPANSIKNIPVNLPIFLVCSKEDHLVPYTSTINVYKKLVETGHRDSYIFIADRGYHAAILPGPEGENYHVAVNAFYKKYNLPHCPASAAKGESILAMCQPTFN